MNYGDYSGNIGEDAQYHRSVYNTDMNIGPLLAYQKIYADFFRDQQWEKPDPSTFNVDYMTGLPGSSMNVQIPSIGSTAKCKSTNTYGWQTCILKVNEELEFMLHYLPFGQSHPRFLEPDPIL